MEQEFGPEYGSVEDTSFKVKYRASCYCKVSCGLCGTPIADEGRRMWLAFPSLFDFGFPPKVPEAFMPTCHIFYGSRVIDIGDDLPKWSGHKNDSKRMF